MGLFSKILGGGQDAEKLEKAAKGFLGDLLSQAGQQQTDRQQAPSAAAGSASLSAESGYSWGKRIPDEPNQYNFGAPFTAYFESIFSSEFSDLRYEKDASSGRNIVYTFFSGAEKALVVELMTERSSANKLRNTCRREGVPYVRFYYDHDGWWNTRAYVIDRISSALR